MIVKAVREGLGRLIILGDYISRPKQMVRSKDAQANIDAQTESLALYQFHACPFCVKTRRTMRRLNLDIALRDAKNNAQHRSDLETLGGRIKVPCLRITQSDGDAQTDQWLYESNDIIAYLEQRFG